MLQPNFDVVFAGATVAEVRGPCRCRWRGNFRYQAIARVPLDHAVAVLHCLILVHVLRSARARALPLPISERLLFYGAGQRPQPPPQRNSHHSAANSSFAATPGDVALCACCQAFPSSVPNRPTLSRPTIRFWSLIPKSVLIAICCSGANGRCVARTRVRVLQDSERPERSHGGQRPQKLPTPCYLPNQQRPKAGNSDRQLFATAPSARLPRVSHSAIRTERDHDRSVQTLDKVSIHDPLPTSQLAPFDLPRVCDDHKANHRGDWRTGSGVQPLRRTAAIVRWLR